MSELNIKRIGAQLFQSKSRDILDAITQDKTSFIVTRNLKECAIMIPYSEEEYKKLLDLEYKKTMANKNHLIENR